MMGAVREPSAAKRLRWRGRCIQTLEGPNRAQRRALAKASVAKFKDELLLAGYDPKDMERKLSKWDGKPTTDPLDALISPQPAEKAERPTRAKAEIAKAGQRDWLHRFDEVK
jgi:hypothetical protein